MLDPFEQRRQQVLQELSSDELDKSRAGGVDERIIALVDCMNRHPDLYTTSSCSGRISVFAEPSAETRAAGMKGGEWVYATHDLADSLEVLKHIQERMVTKAQLIFRCEPFILAAECRDMATAQQLVAVARQAGFRESGVTATKARTIAGIRCSLRLEVPVADEGRMLVDPSYIQKYLVDFGNDKMQANWSRTNRLHNLFQDTMLNQQAPSDSRTPIQSSLGQQDKPKKQHTNSTTPVQQSHLSQYAVEQLTAAGTSLQLLQHIQSSSQPCTGPLQASGSAKQTNSQVPKHTTSLPLTSSIAQHTTGKGSSSSSSSNVKSSSLKHSSRVQGSSSKADFRKKAHLLRVRQEQILDRIRCLRTDEAHSRSGSSSNTNSNSSSNSSSGSGSGSGRGSSSVGVDNAEAGLQWQRLAPQLQGVPDSALKRWGHSTTCWGNKLVVFGGYGGEGAHGRSADILLYDTTSMALTQPAVKGPMPPARMGHSAVMFGEDLVIFGGRISPAQPLNDVWALHLPNRTWRSIQCKGSPPPPRFRHSAVTHTNGTQGSEGMAVFGGYNGQHTFEDTWLLTFSDWTWHQITTRGEVPQARHSHAAAVIHNQMYVFGGTQDYQQAFPELHALDLASWTWHKLVPSTACCPTGCFSHSLTAVSIMLVLAGGCHTLGADHVYTFDIGSQAWSKHTVHNSSSLVLCRHTATALPDQQSIALLGGGMNCFGFGTAFSPPVMLDLASPMHQLRSDASSLSSAQSRSAAPQARTEARSTVPGLSSAEARFDACLPSTTEAGSAAPATARAEASPTASVPPVTEARSTAAQSSATEHNSDPGAATASSTTGSVHPDGSSHCKQENGLYVRLSTGEAYDLGSAMTKGQGQQPAEQGMSLAEPREQGQQPQGQGQQPQGQGQQSAGQRLGLAVNNLQAKAAKDALKALGWLNQSFKAGVHGQRICLPLTDKGSVALIKLQSKCVESQTTPNGHTASSDCQAAGPNAQHTCQFLTDSGGMELPKLQSQAVEAQQAANGLADSPDCQAAGLSKGESSLAANSNAIAHAACLRGLMQNGCAALQPMQAQLSSRHEGGPATRLRAAITQLLQNQGLAKQRIAELVDELPSKWEKLGDLALLPRTCMASPEWGCLKQPLWRAVASALGLNRLAMQAPIANTGTRDSQARLLLGDHGWVQHKEGGVIYSFDVTKCMFSSGNTTERQRMGRMQCAGETVVDLYAGIGYYTLPFLCKAGAAHVIACEWNPNAVEALHKNLQLNGVTDRCQVIEGDCTLTAPKGIADRVSLGLLPSSQGGWETALAALKPEQGGWLHLHHNVTDTEEARCCLQTLESLQKLVKQLKRDWQLRLAHVERVKWYAPHIRHLVFDIQARPSARPKRMP